MFAHKYIYCAVTFDGQKNYWYRTNYRGYRVGDAVIVPITNNCKWGKGTITRIEKYTADKVPFPLNKTKGIVSEFGFFGEAKIKSHNDALEKCKAGAFNISVFAVKTKKGYVEVITTVDEREHFKKNKIYSRFFLIEPFPPAVPEQVASRPPEWRERMKDLKPQENRNDLDWIDEIEMIEDMFPDQWGDM